MPPKFPFAWRVRGIAFRRQVPAALRSPRRARSLASCSCADVERCAERGSRGRHYRPQRRPSGGWSSPRATASFERRQQDSSIRGLPADEADPEVRGLCSARTLPQYFLEGIAREPYCLHRRRRRHCHRSAVVPRSALNQRAHPPVQPAAGIGGKRSWCTPSTAAVPWVHPDYRRRHGAPGPRVRVPVGGACPVGVGAIQRIRAGHAHCRPHGLRRRAAPRIRYLAKAIAIARSGSASPVEPSNEAST